jgi:hypothetical protein
MDAHVALAARALREGDALSALKHVALHDDPPALALRGIAFAQLGELKQAQALLSRAARAFAANSLERARCVLAEAEIRLAARELERAGRGLAAAIATFRAKNEPGNAVHGQLLAARRLVLLGQLVEAESIMAEVDVKTAHPMLAARAALVSYELALRRGDAALAKRALQRGWAAAQRARIPALLAEIERAGHELEKPVARLLEAGEDRPLLLAEVAQVFARRALVVDACRRSIRRGDRSVAFSQRPVLFALLRTLAQAFPGDASRELLIREAFGGVRVDPSHRVRLRVELARLRKTLSGFAAIQATPSGFVLKPRAQEPVVVLAPPVEGAGGAVLALLADGESWSTSSLAHSLGTSQRAVQRSLSSLERAGQARALGRGRARRWLLATPGPFATTLLLPAPPVTR